MRIEVWWSSDGIVDFVGEVKSTNGLNGLIAEQLAGMVIREAQWGLQPDDAPDNPLGWVWQAEVQDEYGTGILTVMLALPDGWTVPPGVSSVLEILSQYNVGRAASMMIAKRILRQWNSNGGDGDCLWAVRILPGYGAGIDLLGKGRSITIEWDNRDVSWYLGSTLGEFSPVVPLPGFTPERYIDLIAMTAGATA